MDLNLENNKVFTDLATPNLIRTTETKKYNYQKESRIKDIHPIKFSIYNPQ